MAKNRLILVLVLLITFLAWSATATIQIVATPDIGNAPLDVSFSFTNDGAEQFIAYAWDLNGDSAIESTAAAPVYRYLEDGTYPITLTATVTEGQTMTASSEVTVRKGILVAVTALPSSGVAPLTVQFTVAATGQEPMSYAWDFNADGIIDTTQQNPVKTFETAGEYNINLKIMDAVGNSASKNVPVVVTKFDSALNLTSYFPTELAIGENSVTFLVENGGTNTIRTISARIVGIGIQHVSSTSIDSLSAGDQDSITVRMNVLQSGILKPTIKILDKSFPVTFTVAQQTQYNKEELQAKYQELKTKLQEQEATYTTKKSEGYLVTEIFDSIKSAKSILQSTQQQLLTSRLGEAQVNMNLAESSLTDIERSLKESQKPKQTVMGWLKENIIMIVAILTGLGTIGGFIGVWASKAKSQAARLGESIKHKFAKKPAEAKAEEKKEEAKAEEKPAEEKKKKKSKKEN